MQAKNKKSLFFSKCAFLYTYTLAYIKSGLKVSGSQGLRVSRSRGLKVSRVRDPRGSRGRPTLSQWRVKE